MNRSQSEVELKPSGIGCQIKTDFPKEAAFGRPFWFAWRTEQ
jgi:hypothetical protein